jgi:CRISPR-associated protein Cas2
VKKKSILIAYDISQPRRLGRVHRYLKKEAIPLQYSIFVTQANQRKIREIIRTIRSIIHEKEDDVRIYELPSDFHINSLGKPLLFKGVSLMLGGLERILQ